MDKKWGNGWEQSRTDDYGCIVSLVKVAFIFKVKKDIKD